MPIDCDRFGIAKLIPTVAGGREWDATWDNEIAREFSAVETDPCDRYFRLHGSGTIAIDGLGNARLEGSPRMYVYDRNGVLTWKNVEVTFYAMRIRESETKSSQGFVCGARSEHQAAGEDPCKAHTYYGRLLYDGRVHFTKEFKHDSEIYVDNRPDDSSRVEWPTTDRTMPRLQWIGLKYLVQNFVGDSNVRLSLYMDLTQGANGGTWQKLVELSDVGDWRNSAVACPTHPADQVWRFAAASVFIRNDALIAADYMKFSIREIEGA